MDNLKHHKYLWRTAVAAGGAILGVSVYAIAITPSGFARASGLAIVTGLAAFWAVGLIDFLFGLPPAEEGVSNQSLSQVSDWLTKILIGASLVQIREIGRFLGDVGEELGSSSGLRSGPELYTALLVATGACGFVFFYFWAYMYWDRLREDAKVRKLEALKKLHDAGEISDAEHRQARAEILSQ